MGMDYTGAIATRAKRATGQSAKEAIQRDEVLGGMRIETEYAE